MSYVVIFATVELARQTDKESKALDLGILNLVPEPIYLDSDGRYSPGDLGRVDRKKVFFENFTKKVLFFSETLPKKISEKSKFPSNFPLSHFTPINLR